MYKIGSPKIAELAFRDSSFTEVFLSLRSLGIFYGTDKYGTRENFGVALKKALNERIIDPVIYWKNDLKNCFFKPYENKNEGVNALGLGLIVPLMTLLTGLGVITAGFSLINLLGFFSLPAFVELAAGIVGLCQAAWYQAKAIYYIKDEVQNNEAQELAKSYFLDAGVHFALVLPMLFVTLVSAPFDLARFITRTIATFIDCLTPTKAFSLEEPEINDEHHFPSSMGMSSY
ncbi:MAG: hypothetical protein H0T84_13710 [Tatlockia sp.]|nr:hypothetical protein [Tatlockia sp.]